MRVNAECFKLSDSRSRTVSVTDQQKKVKRMIRQNNWNTGLKSQDKEGPDTLQTETRDIKYHFLRYYIAPIRISFFELIICKRYDPCFASMVK